MAAELKKRLRDAQGATDDSFDGINTLFDVLSSVVDDLDDIKAKFDAHTHRGDGAQGGAYNTSRPQSDTETVTQVTASSITIGTTQES